MMDMEVTYKGVFKYIIGNEVADFVREHLADELKKLPSFKSGDYD